MEEAPVIQGIDVCVVGSGSRFVSGISYYTHRLAIELARSHRVSVVLMRQLLPTRLYPGRARVGSDLARFRYPLEVRVFDGVDWYWVPSLFRAVWFLSRRRPDVLILEWWTGTVLHSYLVLALLARILRARVVIEFHEVLDTGELNIPAANAYVRLLSPALLRLVNGFVVHNEFDRVELADRYALGSRPIELIPHGPYDQYARDVVPTAAAPPGGDFNLLYFGVIRPFKGLEDLVEAFNAMPPEQAESFRLTVVGETWEGWTRPAELIEASPYGERIDFVNRYVTDDEAASFFAAADAVVLPYHRSSSSGPAHLAMSHGLPLVITAVGGLVEAVAGYEGAITIPPRDPEAIQHALAGAFSLRGSRFDDPHSWETTVNRYSNLFDSLLSEKTGAA